MAPAITPKASSEPSQVNRGVSCGTYALRFVKSTEDLEAVYRLRFLVFNLELGEGLESAYTNGQDKDEFDAVCDHLLVEHVPTRQVIGTYRLQGGDYVAMSALPVTFFPKQDVEAAFAKRAVLVDGSGGRNYMVHASRREAPGMVEVHTKDTDIIYVLKGSATIVTGGTMVDGKTVAPGEIRGREITAGETRPLVPGDVLIIPNGIPHWFKEVQGPLLYYFIKVR